MNHHKATAWTVLVLFVLAVALLSGCVTKIESPTFTQSSESTIAVSGTARAAASPDRAEMMIAIETRADTAKEAQEQNADLSTKVIDAIKRSGVPQNNIETASFNLYPVYDYNAEGSQPKITGYTASHAVSVKTDDAEKASEVIDAAVSAGANRVDSIQFTLTDQRRDKVYRGVLGDATLDAEAKAKAIAETLQVKIKRVRSVTTDYMFTPVYMAVPELAMKAADNSFVPANVDVSATVNVVYEIE